MLTGLNLTVTSLWVGTSVQKSFMFSLTMVGEELGQGMMLMMIENKKTLNTNIFETLDLDCFADPTDQTNSTFYFKFSKTNCSTQPDVFKRVFRKMQNESTNKFM